MTGKGKFLAASAFGWCLWHLMLMEIVIFITLFLSFCYLVSATNVCDCRQSEKVRSEELLGTNSRYRMAIQQNCNSIRAI